jgi:hypothetical protein
MSKHYIASPNIVKGGRIDWNSAAYHTDQAQLTLRKFIHYSRHKSKYPAPGILDYCNESNKPLKFFRSWLDRKGTLVFNISEKQRQKMLPGPAAKKSSGIQPLPCESMINLGKFYQYNQFQTFCLIAKVLFEILFRKSIWADISSQISEPQSDLYLACIESRELAEYLNITKNQESVKEYIKKAFRNYKIKTAEIPASDDPDLVTYYKRLNPRDGSAKMIEMAFDKAVDSLGWIGDIINEKASANTLRIIDTEVASDDITITSVRETENRSYIPVLLEFTYENKLDQVLDTLYNDLAAIKDSYLAVTFRQRVILISLEYKELSGLKKMSEIKDKPFFKQHHKISTRLLKLITDISKSEILDQLERNSRAGKPSDLNHETFDRITSLKEQLARYNWTNLSCIILDVDDYTLLSQKYPLHVAPRVLSIIDTNIGYILSEIKAGKAKNGYNYSYARLSRDKYIILVTMALGPAMALAQELIKRIEDINWASLSGELRVTCSAGVDEWHVKSELFKECIIRATAGLDKARFTRKNGVQKGLETPNRRDRIRKVKTAILSFLFSFIFKIL